MLLDTPAAARRDFESDASARVWGDGERTQQQQQQQSALAREDVGEPVGQEWDEDADVRRAIALSLRDAPPAPVTQRASLMADQEAAYRAALDADRTKASSASARTSAASSTATNTSSAPTVLTQTTAATSTTPTPVAAASIATTDDDMTHTAPADHPGGVNVRIAFVV
jgi:hypothetical protein